jgi:ferric-dicitrate binding protein FerR (iron transport regulator)
VKEGKVNLMQNEINPESVILTKGFSSMIEENQIPSRPALTSPDYALDWIDGRLMFNKTDLAEISAELERYYDIEIHIEENNLKSLTLTGSFSDKNIDTVLEMISLALDIDYEKQSYVSGQDVKAGYIIKSKEIINN